MKRGQQQLPSFCSAQLFSSKLMWPKIVTLLRWTQLSSMPPRLPPAASPVTSGEAVWLSGVAHKTQIKSCRNLRKGSSRPRPRGRQRLTA